MTPASGERLIRDLVCDLRPIRPIPRLRVVILGALGLFAAAVAVHAALGARPHLAPVLADPAMGLVLVGLALAAAGTGAAVLASAVPGREAVVRGGWPLALGGLALAIVAAAWAVLAAGQGAPRVPLAASLACISKATSLGILPLALASGFLVRGVTRRPLLAAAAAALSAVALGAVFVHLSCEAGSALHVLLGHAFAPAVAALVFAGPVALWIRRRVNETPPPI